MREPLTSELMPLRSWPHAAGVSLPYLLVVGFVQSGLSNTDEKYSLRGCLFLRVALLTIEVN